MTTQEKISHLFDIAKNLKTTHVKQIIGRVTERQLKDITSVRGRSEDWS
jgi:hypothetical protein